MSVKITSKPDFKKLAKDIPIKKDDMNSFALDLRSAIRRRIAKGEDINNAKMAAYSKSTKELKGQLGKSKAVNLEGLTGQLLRGFKVLKTSKNMAELGLTLHKKIGYYHHVGTAPYTIKPKTKKALSWGGVKVSGEWESGIGAVVKSVRHPGQKKRKWFGVDKNNEKKFYKRFEKIIGKKVDKWLSQ